MRFSWTLGHGKTITALSIISKILDKEPTQFVVICPKSIINTAWIADAKDFFPSLGVLPVKGGMPKTEQQGYIDSIVPEGVSISKLQDAFKYADVLVMNPEQFKKYVADGSLSDYKGLILDESTCIKDSRSQTSKAVLAFANKCKYVYLLSGKPAPNTPIDYFCQIQAVNPNIFGRSKVKFLGNYFRQVDRLGFKYELRRDMEPLFTKLLDVCSIFVSKQDCLDLPDMVSVVHSVDLAPATMKLYKEMEREQVLFLQDRNITAMNKLTSLMKLRQITSGFIIDTEDKSILSLEDKAKINELANVIEELGDKKAIIWINFKEEVRCIEELLKAKGYTYVTAYQGTEDVDDSINKFKSNEAQFIIAHPKTLKYGVTFTGPSMKVNCTYAIYYSLSYSYEDFYQSRDRIYRKGQTEKCTCIFLLADKTIDTSIYKVLQNKGNNAELLENLAKEWSVSYGGKAN